MACGGVIVRQLFEEHHYFHHSSLAGPWVAAIAQALDQIEQAESSWHAPVDPCWSIPRSCEPALKHFQLAPHLRPEGEGKGAQPLHRLWLELVGIQMPHQVAEAQQLLQ